MMYDRLKDVHFPKLAPNQEKVGMSKRAPDRNRWFWTVSHNIYHISSFNLSYN